LANPCADGVKCDDLKFGWKCGKCPDGYDGERIKGVDLVEAIRTKQVCSDINECQKRRHPCHDDAVCTNTIVSVITKLMYDKIYVAIYLG